MIVVSIRKISSIIELQVADIQLLAFIGKTRQKQKNNIFIGEIRKAKRVEIIKK